ncbi:MAG TPA: wax ester/triacylglycerol synthase family O-acyltransferase [Acidimicrobiales bacterium]|nr:wax ester/triacylglycerol synthase family O-acyltransferase [Acidimicrobiales bacterium]
MKQLTGLDATFLYMETSTTFGHVSGLFIYERPSEDYDAFQAVKDTYSAHLDMFEPLRRRLVEVPFGLDRPYWIEDPNFDLDYHIREIALPAPGNDEQLAEQVARIIARPCDRSRPLWEVYVIEGLASGDFALLSKIHHATVDGAAGAIMTTMLLDPAPDTPLREPGPIPEPEQLPSSRDMLGKGLASLARRPDRTIRLQLRLVQQLAAATRQEGLANVAGAARRFMSAPRTRPRDDRDSAPEAPDSMAPRTPFNASISPHRKVAFRSVPLAQIKDIKSALGATVNDVVMAACAGALRRYLERTGDLPDQPLVGMVPVSIRTGEETDVWTNRVSGLFCPLPTNLADPAERVQNVHEWMAEAKQQWDLLPADMMVELADMAPPALATRAARVATSLRIGDRVNMPINLVISNVPGPREPLYLRGAKVKHYVPVSTIAEGQGLNITVQSYLDVLDFGIVADRDLVPDVWDLVDFCVDEVNVLAELAGVETTEARPLTGAGPVAAPKKKASKRSA